MKFVKKCLLFILKVFFKVFFIIFGKPKFSPLVDKTLNLYKDNDFYNLFSFVRFWDTPFEEIDRLTSKKGTVLDLGSGDGIISNYLALSSSTRKVIGIELNKSRFREAQKGISNTKFLNGDILKNEFPKSKVILLIHVLHHLPSFKDQEIVLKKCKESLTGKGKLIIVEIGERPILKYWFTWLTDAITVPILFENKIFNSKIYFRKVKDWKKLLKQNNFKFVVESIHKNKPFSHVAFVCQKK